MFTSRAEYRTLLRQDNADQRLTPLAASIGLASEERLKALDRKQKEVVKLKSYLSNTSYAVSEINALLVNKKSKIVTQSDKISKVLARPNIDRTDIIQLSNVKDYIRDNSVPDLSFEQAEIQIKYQGYIDKEVALADKMKKLDTVKIPANFDYKPLASLSHEAKEKLGEFKPINLAQASRISGINPSDIAVLMVHLGR